MKKDETIKRCEWPGDDPLYIEYHDKEWGVPVLDDRKLFEFLTLETFQAGLSWIIILRKRKNFRKAFDDFDYNRIAGYNQKKVDELLKNTGIVRNRLKILATITNAQSFMKIQNEFDSFSKYIWGFVNHKPINNKFKTLKEIPPKTKLSDLISNDLKKRGFKFVGSTVIYAYMQAIGIVNDHVIDCFRYTKLTK